MRVMGNPIVEGRKGRHGVYGTQVEGRKEGRQGMGREGKAWGGREGKENMVCMERRWNAWEERGEARHMSKTSIARLWQTLPRAPVRATGSECSTSRPRDISNQCGVLAHPCDIRKG